MFFAKKDLWSAQARLGVHYTSRPISHLFWAMMYVTSIFFILGGPAKELERFSDLFALANLQHFMAAMTMHFEIKGLQCFTWCRMTTPPKNLGQSQSFLIWSDPLGVVKRQKLVIRELQTRAMYVSHGSWWWLICNLASVGKLTLVRFQTLLFWRGSPSAKLWLICHLSVIRLCWKKYAHCCESSVLCLEKRGCCWVGGSNTRQRAVLLNSKKGTTGSVEWVEVPNDLK